MRGILICLIVGLLHAAGHLRDVSHSGDVTSTLEQAFNSELIVASYDGQLSSVESLVAVAYFNQIVGDFNFNITSFVYLRSILFF